MKKIAVLLHNLTIEYSLDLLNGVTQFFEDKDVVLFIAQTKDPLCTSGAYEYQCWASAEYLFSDQMDGYVVITSSYSSYIAKEKLTPYFFKLKDKLVVSVSESLNLPGVYSTKVLSKKAYDEVVSHLNKKHGCTKFAYMSANGTKSAEAFERFESYKNALKANNLKFYPALVFEGSFRKKVAYNVILEKYKTSADIDFDAILCANDLMAVGVQEALESIGVKIPEQVKVFGFDETTHANNATPKLSTIDQDTVQQGYHGAKLAYDILCGKEVPQTVEYPCTPIYRQSCGCIPVSNTEDVYCNDSGEILHKSEIKRKSQEAKNHYFDFLYGIENIYNLIDTSKSAATLKETYDSLRNMIESSQLSSALVMLFEHPVTIKNNEEFIFPDDIRLSMYISENHANDLYEPGIVCNWKKQLIPESILKDFNGHYMIQPIFSGEEAYGYLVCKPKGKDFSIYSVYLKILSNTLAQSYEYSESVLQNKKLFEENLLLQKNNNSLDNQSKTDELTKILNRRGFMEAGQRKLDLSRNAATQGIVLFFDMDGLKTINDTYGHEMGDKAIQSMAIVLSKAFRADDVVGRIGGDEFAAVASGIKMNQVRVLRRRIRKLCEEETIKNHLPFKLSCSAGATPFNSIETQLSYLLSQSDDLLYEEKKFKHSKIKKGK